MAGISAELWVVIPLLLGSDFKDKTGNLKSARDTYFGKYTTQDDMTMQMKAILAMANISASTLQNVLDYKTLTSNQVWTAMGVIYNTSWVASAAYPPTLCLLHAQMLTAVTQGLDSLSSAAAAEVLTAEEKAREKKQ